MTLQFTKYPIAPYRSGYVLQDRAGRRISFSPASSISVRALE